MRFCLRYSLHTCCSSSSGISSGSSSGSNSYSLVQLVWNRLAAVDVGEAIMDTMS